MAIQVVFFVMAGVMLVCFLVALVGLTAGKVEEAPRPDSAVPDSVAGAQPQQA